MSGKPVVYALLMVPQTLTRSTCSAIQLYGKNTVHAHIAHSRHPCDITETHSA